jgi:hypothetical protein
MNKLNKILLVAVPALALSLNANAHDPKMHMKTAEKADCSKMEEMKHDGKMDMKDPVMMAMMKKCMNKEHMDMKNMKMKDMDMKNMKMKDMDMKDMKHDDAEKAKHKDTEHAHNHN